MDRFIFNQQIDRLALVFDRKVSSEKADIFYEALGDIDNERFCAITEKIINNEERFPSLKTINSYRNSTPAKSNAIQSGCATCEGIGTVSTTKAGYRQVFRCPDCHNSEANYPVYSLDYSKLGYELVIPPRWSALDDGIIKGMLVIGGRAWDYAPEKCRIEAEKLLATGWRPSGTIGNLFTHAPGNASKGGRLSSEVKGEG